MNNLFRKGLLLLSLSFMSSCSSMGGGFPDAYRMPQESSNSLKRPVEKTASELIAGVQSVAVLPFVDQTSGAENTLDNGDLKMIAERFSAHLVSSETFSTLIYPQQALTQLIETPFSVNRMDDLKEIGNLLNVDAILFGVVRQYRMYYPPQFSVSMKFYLTRLDRFATSNEISTLAHSGTPLFDYNPTFFRQLWDTSAYYDGSNKTVLKKIKRFYKAHNSSFYGFSEDRALRTKSDFFNFIAYDLSRSLNLFKNKEEDMRPIRKIIKGRNRARPNTGYFK